MSEIPTRTFETPVQKHKVEVREWVNGATKRLLTNEKDATKRHEALINAVCVSIDGKKEDLNKCIDDMHGKDFDFVLLELMKVLDDSSFEKKSEN